MAAFNAAAVQAAFTRVRPYLGGAAAIAIAGCASAKWLHVDARRSPEQGKRGGMWGDGLRCPALHARADAAIAGRAAFVGEYEWTVPSASNLKYVDVMESPKFVIGGYKWTLKLYATSDGRVGVFVWPADTYKLPKAWHRDVPRLDVVLINQADGSRSRSHGFGAVTFCARDTSAYWHRASTLQQLLDPAAGWLLNDTLRVKAVFGGDGDEEGGGGSGSSEDGGAVITR